MTTGQPSTTGEAVELVPECWPAARTDVPSPAWTVRGLFSLPGMVVLWFLPKRVGPSLAASGWTAAIAAHVVGLTFGLGMVVWAIQCSAILFPPGPWPFGSGGIEYAGVDMTWSEYLRAPLVALVIEAHGWSAGIGGVLTGVVVLAGAEGAVVLLAVVLMPFAAGGEHGRALFGRCLRLSLWSTTLLLPLGVGWMLYPLVRPVLGLTYEWHPLDYIALSLFALWWLFVLLRSGYRYVGPPDGPAWQPRTPRCQGCGYTLAHLPVSTNCPECGRPVTESLPQRRRLPAFAAAKTRRQRFRGFWSTLRCLPFGKDFFDRLAINTGHARARAYFLYVCLLNAVTACLGWPAGWALVTATRDQDFDWSWAVVAAAAVFVAQIVVTGLVGTGTALIRRRPVQPTAVIAFYAASSLAALFLGAAILAVTGAFAGMIGDKSGTGPAGFAIIGILLAVGLVACAVGILVAVRTVAAAWSRTRFACA